MEGSTVLQITSLLIWPNIRQDKSAIQALVIWWDEDFEAISLSQTLHGSDFYIFLTDTFQVRWETSGKRWNSVWTLSLSNIKFTEYLHPMISVCLLTLRGNQLRCLPCFEKANLCYISAFLFLGQKWGPRFCCLSSEGILQTLSSASRFFLSRFSFSCPVRLLSLGRWKLLLDWSRKNAYI